MSHSQRRAPGRSAAISGPKSTSGWSTTVTGIPLATAGSTTLLAIVAIQTQRLYSLLGRVATAAGIQDHGRGNWRQCHYRRLFGARGGFASVIGHASATSSFASDAADAACAGAADCVAVCSSNLATSPVQPV